MNQKSEVTPLKDDSATRAEGIPVLDPPYVSGIAPTVLAVGSPDTVVTVTGTGFDIACKGLVNGLARYTQFVSNVSLRITVTAADLASSGQLQIAVKNTVGTSSPVNLTVQ